MTGVTTLIKWPTGRAGMLWRHYGTALVLALAIGPLLFAEATASEVDTVVVAGPRNASFQVFATPVVAAVEGVDVMFHNLDIERHNVVSSAVGPDDKPWCIGFAADECPLFYVAEQDLIASAVIQGTHALPPGVYEFYCEPHPWMLGTLIVSPEV